MPPCAILLSRDTTPLAWGTSPPQLGIAKGSVFQHFGSKDGLFFEVYKKAVRAFPRYLDAPARSAGAGIFRGAALLAGADRAPVARGLDSVPGLAAGNYGTDLTLKREINRFLMAEDPYGTVAFVRFGLQRGELRRDLDQEMIVSILDWTMERFQDALLTEELDPGLFRRQGDQQEKKEARIPSFSICCTSHGANGAASSMQDD